MREVFSLLIVISFLIFVPVNLKATIQFDITGPDGSGQFGSRVVLLPNGNFIVTDPFYDAGPVADVGAVYLYDGVTGQLISRLTGSTAGDKISAGIDGGQSVFADGITLLANGNFVVSSPDWDNGSIVDAGAATWVNGITGLSGVVSAENSLIGSTAGDQVGQGFASVAGVRPLPHGNYIVLSYLWDNASVANAGAVTWGPGNTGVAGIISASNSLVGSTANDSVGRAATVLTNGNYVIGSPSWDNGTITDVGAATWGSGKTGVTGHVSPSNSLVGSTAGDQVAFATPLTNGNYVVGSSGWDRGGTVDAGASTWCDGTTGRVGPVSSANSLVGASNFDRVGSTRALTNGNYVVRSVEWSNRRGAVTWGKGTGGTTGVVSGSNSLVGSTSLDYVGNEIITLNNGNYVVISFPWDNGQVSDAGAVTWGNGDGVTAGVVSASNSLVGTRIDDGLFMSVTRMTNGNYVVSWPWWNNSTGAVTWGSGTTGVSGEISASNSLVGASIGDSVGQVTALTKGNYVVSSSSWSPLDLGAATWCEGTAGTTGVVGAANSLTGSNPNDRVGEGNLVVAEFGNGGTALANGNFIVRSPFWINGSATRAGAVTWVNGSTSTSDVVAPSNSMVGTSADDYLGDGPNAVLTNGNYVVGAPFWDNGAVADVGMVRWGNGTGGTVGESSPMNSLVGSTASDRVGNGGIIRLTNGDYVISSRNWDNGSIVDAGAITYGNGRVGTTGHITSDNSVRGTIAGGGASMTSSYDPVNRQLIVGRLAENIVTLFRPAAEIYSVAGRVMTADGRGLRNASVRLTGPDGTSRTATTSSFGYYTFENVNVGGPYTASVSGRRGFLFPTQVITVNGNLTDVNFIPAKWGRLFPRPIL